MRAPGAAPREFPTRHARTWRLRKGHALPMRPDPIVISPYDAAWPYAFELERERISPGFNVGWGVRSSTLAALPFRAWPPRPSSTWSLSCTRWTAWRRPWTRFGLSGGCTLRSPTRHSCSDPSALQASRRGPTISMSSSNRLMAGDACLRSATTFERIPGWQRRTRRSSVSWLPSTAAIPTVGSPTG